MKKYFRMLWSHHQILDAVFLGARDEMAEYMVLRSPWRMVMIRWRNANESSSGEDMRSLALLERGHLTHREIIIQWK